MIQYMQHAPLSSERMMQCDRHREEAQLCGQGVVFPHLKKPPSGHHLWLFLVGSPLEVRHWRTKVGKHCSRSCQSIKV